LGKKSSTTLIVPIDPFVYFTLRFFINFPPFSQKSAQNRYFSTFADKTLFFFAKYRWIPYLEKIMIILIKDKPLGSLASPPKKKASKEIDLYVKKAVKKQSLLLRK